MKEKCPQCGKELAENWIIEPGLGKICQNCYLNHVFSERYDLDDTHVIRSLNSDNVLNRSRVKMK